MRILIVSQYFLPQPLANAETIGAIATGLAERGHHIEVVAPVKQDPQLKGVRVRRAFGYFASERASTWKRAVEYLTFTAGAILGSLRARSPDVVLVPSPPPTLGLAGLLISRLKRSRLVYVVQDLYPEVAVAAGAMQTGPVLNLLGGLMRHVYRRSAAVVVIDPYFVDVIERVEPSALVRAVPNGIDLAPFAGASRDDAFLSEIGVPKGARVVMYAGNVGRSQDIDGVIRAAAGADAHLVVHGGGATMDELRVKVQRHRLDHVHFSSYRPRDELGSVFASGDVHVVPLKPGIAASSVPSKLLSIFAAGRPAVVAAEPGSPTARVVEEAGGGWVVTPGDEQALECAIRAALDDEHELLTRGAAGRAWAVKHAGADRCARDYEAVLNEVLQR